MLPENKKVERDATKQMKLWVYGEPTIGKTIFANKFPNALFLNTDGNIKYIDSPAIPIVGNDSKDSWEVFVDSVDALSKEKHDYETIVVDLLEDVFQACRQHYTKKLKIEHEGDLGYGKGWDIVRNAFLIVIRTLVNQNMNVVLISHEKAVTIKDRIGRELTRFQPNLSEGLANKISGLVDITGRITIKTEETEEGVVDRRVLYVDATKEQVGGNRIPGITKEFIDLEYTELRKLYRGGR